WVSLALVGCQPGDAEDALESPIVSSSPPYTGPSVDDPALYPALVAHGRLPDGAFTDTTELAAHTASFTDAVNLAAAPATAPASTTASRTAAASGFGAVPDAAHLEAPAFAAHLGEAVGSADLRLGALSTTALDDAASVFSVIPGFHHDPPVL